MSFLYRDRISVSGGIEIVNPTLREVVGVEDDYYANVMSIVATPYDMMVQLDDIGIDFTKITDYELFLMMAPKLAENDTSLIFGNIDLSRFRASIREDSGDIVLYSSSDGLVIDEAVYRDIANTLRLINDIENPNKRPGNEAARKYMIERARVKQKRAAKKKKISQLDPYIIALVNAPEFKYDYAGILDLTLYQFHASLKQVVKSKSYDHLMTGCYSGSVDIKNIDKSELTWIQV